MENQVVLIIGLAFVAALGFILRQANTPAPQKQIKEKPVRQPKPQKTKKQPAQKKSQKKGAQITEWVGVDTATKDAQDMLEFLKGRDPKEISKVLKSQNPKPKPQPQAQAPVVQNSKKGKNQKQQAQNDSSNEAAEEGFSVIQKKAPKQKKEKKGKQPKEEEKDEGRSPRVKSFFRSEEEEIQKVKKERAEARAKGEKRERPPREDRPKRERKEKKEGEEGSASESDSGAEKPRQKRERREKPEGEQSERPPRTIVAPNVPKYELPDINDMLNSITKNYKATPKNATPPPPRVKKERESSLFSKIPRSIVMQRILPYLTAKELVCLSQVNQYFQNAAKKDSLWKPLYVKEFGTENIEGVTSLT
jgi:hypothetical protein